MATSKLVIVTGATGTLGTAVYRQLIAEGYHPVLVARNQADLSDIKAAHGDKLSVHACDVTDPQAVAGIFRQPFMQDGILCGVVTCAGLLKMGGTENFADEDWDGTIRTNLSGTHYVFRQAIPHMKEHGGTLIAIGSRWANGAATAAAYSASKSALRGLVAAMQKEFAGSNIRPVLISPGSIASPMSSSVNNGTQALDILHPEDVAATILHVLGSPQRVIFNEITMLAYNYDLTDQYAA